MIYVYRFLWVLMSPIVDIWFIYRLFNSKEDKSRLKERIGLPSLPRPNGKLIWFHASSVGETLSILPLIHALLEEDEKLHILVTSGTVTSAKLMRKKLPERAFHQYVPLDFYTTVMAFMEHWKPDVSVFVESEFWPELLHQAPNKILINARMSDRSFARYSRHKWFIQKLLSGFKACLAQSNQDAVRLESLGIQKVEVSGNLKFDLPEPHIDEAEMKKLTTKVGNRKVLVVSSTHEPEEVWLGAIHLKLKEKIPSLLTIVAPRHPHRGAKVAEQLGELGKVSLRSQKEHIDKDTDFYIADTIGEMPLWYSLAQQNGVAFIGGSLIPHGGQSPLEALKLNVPVVCGPYMMNFREMMTHLLEAGAIVQVEDIESLASTLYKILSQKTHRNKIIKPIGLTLSDLSGATDYVADRIINLLPRGFAR
jgi:3-deoxy-D-manno-octulosonic-acid transferase